MVAIIKCIEWIIRGIIYLAKNMQSHNSYPSNNRTYTGGISVATYEQIQDYVRRKYSYVPETCWIAHCKEICGLKVRDAPNRISNARTNPYP